MLCGFDILIVIISRGIVFKVPKFTFDVVKSVYIHVHCTMYYCLKMNVIYVCLCCLHVL